MKLQLRGLSARHPAARVGAAAALQALDLNIAEGEHLAVIGASGAGKTSLLQVLALAMPPSAGGLQIDGQDPWAQSRHDLRRLRGALFLAPQLPPLPPRQRVVTAVLAGRLPSMSLLASLRSLAYPSDIPAAHEALCCFDIGDKLFERVDRLSGGERQRVGLARALLAPARLWLVDEPLSALDPTRARLALTTLLRKARERRVTLVASLHQVELALAHFPRVVGLREGRKMFDLPADQISRKQIERLYAHHEDELYATPAMHDDASADAPAAVPMPMQCR